VSVPVPRDRLSEGVESAGTNLSLCEKFRRETQKSHEFLVLPLGSTSSAVRVRPVGFGPLWHLQFNREKLLNSAGADLESLLNARSECFVSTLQFPAERRLIRGSSSKRETTNLNSPVSPLRQLRRGASSSSTVGALYFRNSSGELPSDERTCPPRLRRSSGSPGKSQTDVPLRRDRRAASWLLFNEAAWSR